MTNSSTSTTLNSTSRMGLLVPLTNKNKYGIHNSIEIYREIRKAEKLRRF